MSNPPLTQSPRKMMRRHASVSIQSKKSVTRPQKARKQPPANKYENACARCRTAVMVREVALSKTSVKQTVACS